MVVVVALLGAIGVAARQSAWPVPRGIHEPLKTPAANPLTAEKIELGRMLFSDVRLSRTSEVSCATCHDPARAFSDARPLAVGVRGRIGRRHSPALINRGFGDSFFWDGRAATLEAQVVMPIADPSEMDFTVAAVVSRLKDDAAYAARFRSAFGRAINEGDIARALASFVRSILSGDSRVDRFLEGDLSALTRDEQRGLSVFRGRGLCTACHVGSNFSDERFHNTGVAWISGDTAVSGSFSDRGRGGVTNRKEDDGAFRTPTLREVSRTAPYMHNGSLATLEAVVDFYEQGGRENPNLDKEMMALRLTPADKSALVAFLKALTGNAAR